MFRSCDLCIRGVLKFKGRIDALKRSHRLDLTLSRTKSSLTGAEPLIIMDEKADREKEKKLFTPGPLSTSLTVKKAMLRDLGSRDKEFIRLVRDVRETLLEISGVSGKNYTSIPLQGSGTYAVEAVIQNTSSPVDGKVLLLVNGAYGKRMAKICTLARIQHEVLSFSEDQPVDVTVVKEHLQNISGYTLIAVVHCETSSGVLNPITEIGSVIQEHSPRSNYFIDAMSSFGAIPFDMEDVKAHFIVSSANKCLQGVPGFSFIVAKTDRLLKCKGNCRSLSLDIVDQYLGLEGNGQFRFTPPTHALLAFKKALDEFNDEGGVQGRSRRYRTNNTILRDGMKKLGFKELLHPSCAGPIITSFYFPQHPNFNFAEFYVRLNELDQVIYPGKVTDAECFRIGNIGHLFSADMYHLLDCVEKVCREMSLPIPLTE